jgi:hypothetical protein
MIQTGSGQVLDGVSESDRRSKFHAEDASKVMFCQFEHGGTVNAVFSKHLEKKR